SCIVLDAKTVGKLWVAQQAGVEVLRTGTDPRWQETENGIEPLTKIDWPPDSELTDLINKLPRLVHLDGDGRDIRCTAWRREGKTMYLFDNLRDQPASFNVNGHKLELPSGQVVVEEGDLAEPTKRRTNP